LLEDDQLANASGVLAELKETGSQRTPAEFRLRRKTVDYVDVETKASVILRDGQPYAVLGMGHDITDRKRAEEELRESEEKHRRLFETMSQGVVYQAANGAIVSANPAAERILGLSLDQMMGRTSSDPGWEATREDGSDFPGNEHPAMVALRTGEPVYGVTM
jgi:PAS domain-containing protein